ncbi:sulfite exporter TauE/SafE family protein [Apibacter muscae]|uniref:Sulfite exporter TauE/SafE family protein n=1 Tax=Apibacter muscae TaxID=2509004 RepID=A0A563DI23_9FLAO|nr:sulfite exporter TauE/SafE family protein [Apibacter muscae]TWP29787.1 sulfite exporter TauE/SafE family protein [Apibacter muscae]
MEIGIYVYALTLGLLSGTHCIGMCGPIAFSLGLEANNKVKYYTQNFLYQLGRISTYSILGGILGIVGKSFNIAGYQQYVSIFAGVLLLLMVLLPGKNFELGGNLKFLNHFMIKVKMFLGKFIQKKDNTSRYLTGVLNGFLPCGVVYASLAASIAAGGIIQGMLFMAIFGLGTFPFMFITVLAGNFIGIKAKTKVTKVFPYFLALLGIIFILRGLEIGIPYLSPPKKALKIEKMEDKGKSCCH